MTGEQGRRRHWEVRVDKEDIVRRAVTARTRRSQATESSTATIGFYAKIRPDGLIEIAAKSC